MSTPVTGLDKETKEGQTQVRCPKVVLVLGDSQVRPLDSEFCGEDVKRRTRCGYRESSCEARHVLGWWWDQTPCYSKGWGEAGCEELYRRYRE